MIFSNYQQRTNQILEKFLPSEIIAPQRIHQAMRYSVLNGGKRIRPLLVYATGEIFNADLSLLDYPAAAIEFIHCYSLIHDDLPAMDDDALRRGKPTCHKAFDEATAIIAGDALQALAFKVLGEIEGDKIEPKKNLLMLQVLAAASGSLGMCGGQMLDLQAVNKKISLAEMEKIHCLKTGALIAASVKLGAIVGNASPSELELVEQFANHLGLAFQIQDDIVDVESSTEQLGKKQGADQSRNKSTYVSLLGITAAKEYLQHSYQMAMRYLTDFGDAAVNLQGLAKYIVQRQS